MNILYILYQFPGLSETFIFNEIAGLMDLGHNVRIISLHKPLDCPREMVPDKVREYDMLSKTTYFGNNKVNTDTCSAVVDIVKEEKIDHMHCHYAKDNVEIAYIVNDRTGISYTVTTHAWSIFIKPSKNIRKWANRSKMFIAISEFNRKYLHRKLGVPLEKIEVITTGLYVDRIMPIEKYLVDPFRIVSLSRLVEKKGYPYLIKACKRLRKRGIKLLCEIRGFGPQQQVLENIISKNGLEEEVRLGGPVSHSEAIELMAKASVFVLPCVRARNSDMDGVPNVLMEAMALEVPVISTRISGIPELIENGVNGLVVRPRSSRALAKAILKVKDNRDLAEHIRRKSREKVLKKFNVKKNVALLIELFRQ